MVKQKPFVMNFGEAYSFPWYVRELVKPAEFQRLREVSQLGHTRWVYPNGTQTRFAHSLGVTKYALEMLENAVGNSELSLDLEKWQRVISATGVYHDLGHAPGSHGNQNIFEYKTGLSHETVSGRIITGQMNLIELYNRLPSNLISDLERKVKLDLLNGISTPDRLIKDVLSEDPELIAQIVDPKRGDNKLGENLFLREIMSGIFDADRLYYVKWDPILTGIRQAEFNSDYLKQRLTIIEVEGKKHLALRESALDDAYQLLDNRAKMHCVGYTHRTVLKVEAGFNEAIKLALDSIPELVEPIAEYLYLMEDSEFERLVRLSPNPIAHHLYNLAKLTRMRDYGFAFVIDSDRVANNGNGLILEKLDGITEAFPHRKIRDQILERVNVGKATSRQLESHELLVYYRKAKTARDPEKLKKKMNGLWIVNGTGLYNAGEALENSTLFDQKIVRLFSALSRPINSLDFMVLAPRNECERVRKVTEEYLEDLVK